MADLLIRTNMKYNITNYYLLSSCKGEGWRKRPQASRMEARPTRRLLTRKETGVKVLNL